MGATMSSDVARRIYQVIAALGRAPEPDIERIEHLVRRAGRLDSLRRQVERLQDELELELISSDSGWSAPQPPMLDMDEELADEPPRRTHSQPPRALRCQRPI
jgi:HEPN domain-containing protein